MHKIYAVKFKYRRYIYLYIYKLIYMYHVCMMYARRKCVCTVLVQYNIGSARHA